jgi:kynurenine formamidase
MIFSVRWQGSEPQSAWSAAKRRRATACAPHGISNFENLDLDVLSQEKVYEFLFTWSPLKLVGATGSPGNPIAAW